MLYQTFKSNEKIQGLLNEIAPESKQLALGLSGSARSLVYASIAEQNPNKTLIVVQNNKQLYDLLGEIGQVIGADKIFAMPLSNIFAENLSLETIDELEDRLKTYEFLASEKQGVVIATATAAFTYAPTIESVKSNFMNIKVGDELGEPKALFETLINAGYVAEHTVMSPGEIALRASIIDIYPVDFDNPVRIEFWDTEIDSIRYFDSETQRTIEKVNDICLMPKTDVLTTKEDLKRASAELEKIKQKVRKKLEINGDLEKIGILEEELEPIIHAFKNDIHHEKERSYLDLLYSSKVTLVDLFKDEDVFIVDELARIKETVEMYQGDIKEYIVDDYNELQGLSSLTFGFNPVEKIINRPNPQLYFSVFNRGLVDLKLTKLTHFEYEEGTKFLGNLDMLRSEVERLEKLKYQVIIAAPKEKIDPVLGYTNPKYSDLKLHTGFYFENELALITEAEIFKGVYNKPQRKRQNLSNAERISSYSELEVNDFVVHENHGIGRYVGVSTIEVETGHKDFITILYSDGGKLYVPLENIAEKIAKYSGSDDAKPRLDKLGSKAWQNRKTKASKKIEDIADHLIDLYSKRQSLQGFAFSPDTELDHEFKEAFPFPETDDQIRSIAEIKDDMEKPRPMDRLLIGDVGFGKTEVALRAAMKAVQDAKQVALLAPTTILTQQHYETMIKRFAGFPVNIAVLNRFKTKKQQDEIIEQIRTGSIDIVIGTHRLLSQDVKFADLGLLVIDEEQRFGVKHKERLKEFKNQVDVLTLSATPIPRTMHMSMLGIRDLSLLETPPFNRFPVQTRVLEHNDTTIKQAVERELARDGQVFYLFNRVENIDSVAAKISQLVPTARVGVAHGQMTANQLENVIYDFIEKKYDVLVATTIIETGVDIPNANTLIVENAQNFGLSTLYQLRGRVGRMDRIAYAYFLIPENRILSEESEKRLQAIRDFTQLGAGFKIAKRDLSIRGAGMMFGKVQHGFIDELGFEMYNRILSEAISLRKGEPKKIQKEVRITLDIEAYIPDNYLNDSNQKIEIYKKIKELETLEEYNELYDDIIDRFGPEPKEVANLMEIGLISMYAKEADILAVTQTNKAKQQQYEINLKNTNTMQVYEAARDVKMQMEAKLDSLKPYIIFRNNQPEHALKDLITFTKELARIKTDEIR
ncbi:MAG: transcription-repair coupling factor [Lactobacillales bacterium]|jgi:transcription-repair coupling factor (superfamily II helicase)|nr:transcription-repair coupling factor [Lactobacillales bacterium]